MLKLLGKLDKVTLYSAHIWTLQVSVGYCLNIGLAVQNRSGNHGRSWSQGEDCVQEGGHLPSRTAIARILGFVFISVGSTYRLTMDVSDSVPNTGSPIEPPFPR